MINEAIHISGVVLPFVGTGIILVVPLAVAEYLKYHAIQKLEELQRCGDTKGVRVHEGAIHNLEGPSPMKQDDSKGKGGKRGAAGEFDKPCHLMVTGLGLIPDMDCM